MKLTKDDVRVFQSFLDGNPAGSKKFTTNGYRLDGHGMGGNNIAEWWHGILKFNDLGSRFAQTVQHKLSRMSGAHKTPTTRKKKATRANMLGPLKRF